MQTPLCGTHTIPTAAPALFLLTDDLCGSREMSPPRQRKPTAAVAGTERKFSWATQRITELTHDLEKAQKQAKVCCMHALQDSRAGHHSQFQGAPQAAAAYELWGVAGAEVLQPC